MRTRRRASIEDLRLAIECLPTRTKVAMLEGIRTNPIIVGAYSTRDGICPMLAAHRAGGRTDLIAFARAWDRFAMSGSRRLKTRRATERELLILRAHLEASLLEADAGPLDVAIREHRELVAARPPRRELRSAGDPNRTAELSGKPGWAWTRLFRRYDDYEHAMERLADERRREASPREASPREPSPRETAPR